MAKTTRVVMPQLGESVHEGTISKWLVQPGDKVVEFEPMLEVDTDKVSAEVPAPVTGVLREILAKEGQTVQAGAEIAVVEVGGDGEASAPPRGEVARSAGGGAEPSSPPRGEVARSAGGGVETRKTEPTEAAPAEAPSSPKGEGRTSGELPSGEHRYSPAVQMVASELNVDLSRVEGTGFGGRVTKKDVQD
ncbi:MAG: hypothetical protein E6J37_09395, partial [Chloroflexi bacterium]